MYISYACADVVAIARSRCLLICRKSAGADDGRATTVRSGIVGLLYQNTISDITLSGEFYKDVRRDDSLSWRNRSIEINMGAVQVS